jgi:tetratricopeptide (TPR) repeat protein
MTEEQKLPERPRAHVTGDRAVTVFKFYRRPEWVVNEVESDYGFDLIITTEHEGHVQNLFLAQLKGSDSPDYSADGEYASVEMKVSTINHLFKQPCLTIICLCDTGRIDEPIYWVWLHEFIEVLGEKKNWQTQETVSIRIPTSNKFDRSACEDIEKYLSNYYKDQRIEMAILEVLQPAMGEERLPSMRTQHDPDMTTMLARKMKPFEEAGVIEIIQEEEDKEIIKAYSPEDQARFRKIQEISNALNELRDLGAEKGLSELSRDIEDAADGIKAKYHNNVGVLSLHKGDSKKAIEEFEIAGKLRPKEQKYITNLLTTQFSIAFDSKCFESSLPIDWIKRLEQVLVDKPEFCSAIRLKASWLCYTAGTRTGEEFLRSSKCWDIEKEKCSIHLAGIFGSLGELDNALKLLNEANIQENADDPVGLSLYANTLLKKAIGFTSTEDQFLVKGPGPSKLNLSLLKESERCYRRVITLYRQKSFPHISEDSINNYTTVLYLLDPKQV